MKALTINTNNIIMNTDKCVHNNKDIATAMRKGLMLEILKKRMMRGEVVRFCYQKLNGSIRFAVGTLQAEAVQSKITGNGLSKRYFNMFVYIDLQKMAWRGFKPEKLIGIID